MEKSLQITFRGLESSDAVRAKIEEKAARLDKVCDRITGCRVVIETPHKHHHKGKLYQVRIDLSVPGADIVVNRKPQSRHAHEDIYVALRDAFDAAKGKLEDYLRRRQRKVKSHEEPAHGRVVKLLP
jgi:ribosomal subunit interface protein